MASEETAQSPSELAATAVSTSTTAEAVSAAPEKLDEIEEIDFLLEEIESKIAPLALA
ncbi:Xan family putative trans-acting RiPP leader peptide [Myxococcus sp. CA051A]|uniref:Xan family putative trans-acting RiPP leader peptide n=1 Tax=Myxococcus llanfairpwllgwyngyllgogerychwyrndrobwllllantysiliogogogochensis TaxID=2590453 RepID=A0A540X092_9BACT|nr:MULTISPECIES: Xan family putative trans-acting RiPP leader peptide [Myxococcus]NTX04729.1 Xan family putative trans-acting RiPP leader peptide [Myxococcus sp. CA040A]NTX15071.1 Xan family putative trans-acting RiPP leader peptide [Myxococcus sp. CA056]NTX36074.1 Xan family putative trans-acting RiPP leader peptide [Myxococcus sp. CA033]NTX55024.1 Xan family putative trans-acting RiPP leader peptide [Myxococcus sp. CA039A]NTX63802.1 Xan family putative trans-acting RiPP leader peptide [Myxoc